MMNMHLPLQKVRIAHTLFCDEVRQEVNGKAIFIGVYSTEMFVPALPLTLPTFSALVTVSSPVDMPLKRLIVRLWYGDDVIAEAFLPEGELEAHFGAAPKTDDSFSGDSFQVFRSMVVINIAPFTLDKEGILKVRVETESEIIPAGAIAIKVASAPTPAGS